MSKKILIGNNNIANKISSMYIGVNNVAKKVNKIYVGVNGKAKLCYPDSSGTRYELITGWKFRKDNYVKPWTLSSNPSEYYYYNEDYNHSYLSMEDNEKSGIQVSGGEQYRIKINPYNWKGNQTGNIIYYGILIGYSIHCLVPSELNTTLFEEHQGNIYTIKSDLTGNIFTTGKRGIGVSNISDSPIPVGDTGDYILVPPESMLNTTFDSGDFELKNEFEKTITIPDECKQLIISTYTYSYTGSGIYNASLTEEIVEKMNDLVTIEKVITS